jgi:hypothetical protein
MSAMCTRKRKYIQATNVQATNVQAEDNFENVFGNNFEKSELKTKILIDPRLTQPITQTLMDNLDNIADKIAGDNCRAENASLECSSASKQSDSQEMDCNDCPIQDHLTGTPGSIKTQPTQYAINSANYSANYFCCLKSNECEPLSLRNITNTSVKTLEPGIYNWVLTQRTDENQRVKTLFSCRPVLALSEPSARHSDIVREIIYNYTNTKTGIDLNTIIFCGAGEFIKDFQNKITFNNMSGTYMLKHIIAHSKDQPFMTALQSTYKTVFQGLSSEIIISGEAKTFITQANITLFNNNNNYFINKILQFKPDSTTLYAMQFTDKGTSTKKIMTAFCAGTEADFHGLKIVTLNGDNRLINITAADVSSHDIDLDFPGKEDETQAATGPLGGAKRRTKKRRKGKRTKKRRKSNKRNTKRRKGRR